MDNSPVVICPRCLYPIGEGRGGDRRCTNPRCGVRFDEGDWALPAVYGTEGLLSPSEPGSPWRLPDCPSSSPSSSTPPGRVDSPLPLPLKPENGPHHVGGSMTCHVRLSGPVPERAVSLHCHRPSGTWWVFDWCSNPGCATVNGKRFRNHQLEDNDILTVAGVKLRYRPGVLEAEHGSGDGIVLSVAGLTDARMSRTKSGEDAHPLLDRVSFVVPDGQFVGILGPSGCGKSTLIKTLAGLSSPAKGTIAFNGNTRATAADSIRALVGYLPQDVNASLHDELTLREEIRSYLAIHVASKRSDAKRTEERTQKLLETFGLDENASVGDLSGGERRRAALLLAMLRNPSVLLLDEPAAGLDRASETDLMNLLQDLTKPGLKKTVLCATHELANLHLFHRILVMAKGTLVYDGPPDGVFGALGIPDEAGEDRARQLYEKLDDPEKHEVVGRAIRECRSHLPAPQAKRELHPPKRASRFGTFAGYLGRFRDSFLSFARSGRNPSPDRSVIAVLSAIWTFLKRWLFNPPLVLFFWQPLLVSLCTAVALKSSFTAGADERKIVFFASAIAAFYIGMGGSVRCLVANRKGRCLERLDGVRRGAYLSAVAFATFAKSSAQGIVLTVFLFLLPRWFGVPAPWNATPAVVFALAACLVSVELAGGFVGLAVSACAPSEAFAVAMVPSLAIFALFFSEPLMDFPKDDVSPGARIARALPAHYAYLSMFDWESTNRQEIEERAGNTASLAKTVPSWIVLCLIAALASQSIYEKNWKG